MSGKQDGIGEGSSGTREKNWLEGNPRFLDVSEIVREHGSNCYADNECVVLAGEAETLPRKVFRYVRKWYGTRSEELQKAVFNVALTIEGIEEEDDEGIEETVIIVGDILTCRYRIRNDELWEKLSEEEKWRKW